MQISKRGLALFAATITFAAPVLAEQVKTEGVIVARTATDLDVRTQSGRIKVALAPSTKIKETHGLSSTTRQEKALIPGLIIQVKGDQQGDRVAAASIQFKRDDLHAAIATRAGTAEQFATAKAEREKATAERAQLRAAIIGGQEYEIRDEATVYFAVGKSAVAAQYQQQLRQLAQKASSFGNYRVSILGFADPTGNAAANERLSMQRALAVSNFLRQSGAIEPGRVLSPSAMGEGTIAPGEKAPAGNDQARRVVVRLVTPKVQLSQ